MIKRAYLDGLEIDEIYKSANVAPIHKGSSLGKAKNYTMLGFISHIIKVFGKIVGHRIIEFLKITEKIMTPYMVLKVDILH